jgi:Arc/MetJ-type ribon-helix-helix transcriptional regulator
MAKSKAAKPKTPGRSAPSRDALVGVRLPPGLIAQIDGWSRREEVKSRSKAIRRLVELGLAGARPMKRRPPKAASKALDLAARQIDKLADSSATVEERHKRKQRLLKGPGEFREMRGDLPKPKG